MKLSAVPLRTIAACAAVAALALATGCNQPRPATSENVKLKAVSDRKDAPPFSLKDADGRTVSLADYKGKVVLLNFWATWCGPCKIEIPWFVEFEQKFKDRGFSVVGVSMDEDGWEIVKPYIQKERVNYRILLGTDTVAGLYGGVESLPTTFLIDGSGKIASTHVGLVSKDIYENEIQQLLSNPNSTSASRMSVAVELGAK